MQPEPDADGIRPTHPRLSFMVSMSSSMRSRGDAQLCELHRFSYPYKADVGAAGAGAAGAAGLQLELDDGETIADAKVWELVSIPGDGCMFGMRSDALGGDSGPHSGAPCAVMLTYLHRLASNLHRDRMVSPLDAKQLRYLDAGLVSRAQMEDGTEGVVMVALLPPANKPRGKVTGGLTIEVASPASWREVLKRYGMLPEDHPEQHNPGRGYELKRFEAWDLNNMLSSEATIHVHVLGDFF